MHASWLCCCCQGRCTPCVRLVDCADVLCHAVLCCAAGDCWVCAGAAPLPGLAAAQPVDTHRCVCVLEGGGRTNKAQAAAICTAHSTSPSQLVAVTSSLIIDPTSTHIVPGCVLFPVCACASAAGSGVATTISLAALCGSHLVVACGSHLTCLVLDCCQGTLTVAATAQLEQQASALNLFRLQGTAGVSQGCVNCVRCCCVAPCAALRALQLCKGCWLC